MNSIIDGVRIGVVATIGVDLAALFSRQLLRLPTTDWALMGRWFGHGFKGVFMHAHIAKSEPIPHERVIGWAGHYLTGVVYAVIYMGIVESLPAAAPTVRSAIVFGLATLAAPWFLVQPLTGAGVFAMSTPHPWPIRIANALMHLVFGAGLFAGWVLVG